ncbi:MAG TPA: vWA domain-containing protein, partial [Chthonomonadaceae bacterium]|nr:vWA domain-containing protein [Chthonomonadaceae bacterium]
KKVDDGAGGLVEQTVKFPVWFDPIASGGTPMCQALNGARAILTEWLAQHPGCFPPIVINITDGESTDGDPTQAAQGVQNLASDDGNVLFFNLHLSSHSAKPIEFPDSEAGLPDKFAQLLFRLSSPLPEYMRAIAQQEGFNATQDTRGFVFNADMVSVIRFLDIGTRPSNLR